MLILVGVREYKDEVPEVVFVRRGMELWKRANISILFDLFWTIETENVESAALNRLEQMLRALRDLSVTQFLNNGSNKIDFSVVDDTFLSLIILVLMYVSN